MSCLTQIGYIFVKIATPEYPFLLLEQFQCYWYSEGIYSQIFFFSMVSGSVLTSLRHKISGLVFNINSCNKPLLIIEFTPLIFHDQIYNSSFYF